MKLTLLALLFAPFSIIAMEEWHSTIGPYPQSQNASQENKQVAAPLQRLVPSLTDLCLLAITHHLNKTPDTYIDLQKKLPEGLPEAVRQTYHKTYGWSASDPFNIMVQGNIIHSEKGTFAIDDGNQPSIIDTIRKKKIEIELFWQHFLFKQKLGFITQSFRPYGPNSYAITGHSQDLQNKKNWRHVVFFRSQNPLLVQISPIDNLIAIASNDSERKLHIFSANSLTEMQDVSFDDPIHCIGFNTDGKKIYIGTTNENGKTTLHEYGIEEKTKKEIAAFIQDRVTEGRDSLYCQLEVSPQENCIILRHRLSDLQPKIFVKQTYWKELPLVHSPKGEDKTIVRLAPNGSFILYNEYKTEFEWPTYIYWPESDTKKQIITVDGYLDKNLDEFSIASDSSHITIREHHNDVASEEYWIPYKFAASNNWQPEKLRETHPELLSWLQIPGNQAMYGITNDLKCLILNSKQWHDYITKKGNIDYCPKKNVVSYFDDNDLYIYSAINGGLVYAKKYKNIIELEHNRRGVSTVSEKLSHPNIVGPMSMGSTLFATRTYKQMLFSQVEPVLTNEIAEIIQAKEKQKSPDV